jgi:hypothetical protein
MKQYIAKEIEGGNAIRIDVDYSLGGMNYFSGNVEPRGIYVHISPVSRGGGFETYTAFSGAKMCVAELKRSTPKVLQHYEKLVADNADQLATWFVTKQKNLIHEWLTNLPKP